MFAGWGGGATNQDNALGVRADGDRGQSCRWGARVASEPANLSVGDCFVSGAVFQRGNQGHGFLGGLGGPGRTHGPSSRPKAGLPGSGASAGRGDGGSGKW